MKYFNVLIVLVLCITPLTFAQKMFTLESAMETARENSPDIMQYRLSLERSQQLLKAQKAALRSKFNLSVTPFEYTKVREFNTFYNTWNDNENTSYSGVFSISQPIEWTDGTISLNNQLEWQDAYSEFSDTQRESYSNNLYLSYNQPIFTYNRTRLELRSLELDLENASINYALRMLMLEYNVTQSYYSVYSAKMSYNIAVEEYNNQEASYQIIKNKVDAGISAMEELYQAEVNLATSKSTMQNAKLTWDNALDQFKQMIGISILEDVDVTADVTHVPVTVDMQKAIDTGLASRMEMRQRSIDIENALATLTETKAYNEFKGDVTVSYGIIGTNEQYANIYDEATKNQRVAVSFDIPLFDWGERKARIKASEVTLETNRLRERTQKDEIIIGIRQAVRNLKNLEIQIEIARQNVRNSELTYEINLEKYQNGDLTSMDLNLYQTQLSDRKNSLISALIDYKLALLNLKIESMWDFVRNEPVVPEYK